jgi:hypothetical protein
VLLRPPCYLSLPIRKEGQGEDRGSFGGGMCMPNFHHPGRNDNSDDNSDIICWTPSTHVVDIRCTIISVTRSSVGKNGSNQNQLTTTSANNKNDVSIDSVTATWLRPADDAVIKLSYNCTSQKRARKNSVGIVVVGNDVKIKRSTAPLIPHTRTGVAIFTFIGASRVT